MPGKKPEIGAVIVAGGSGARFGGRYPKQFHPVLGKPMLLRTLLAIGTSRRIRNIVVVAPGGFLSRVRGLVKAAGLSNRCTVVAGGKTRQASVCSGLMAFSPPPGIVLIHDGARPLVSKQVIDGVLKMARKHKGVIAALPVTDTLKKGTRDGVVGKTLDRTGYWTAQTPQVFDFQTLLKAHRKARSRRRTFTDDAALVEQQGISVRIFPGSQRNIKITTRADVAIAEMWLKNAKTRRTA